MWGVVVLLVAGVARAGSAPIEAPRLRIKNGHHMNVALGRSRQDAFGVRPDKKAWPVDLGAELIGTEAELEDVTPNARGERWTLPVAGAKLTLDPARFLPSHVYRLDVRRAHVLVGTALIYLYPPPFERVRRVDLDDRPEAADRADDAGGLGVIPKGGL
jgi:hypothetical protein